MSMNLYVEASREVIVVKTGKKEIETCEYELWQTPTNVTRKALARDNPIEVYRKWVQGVHTAEYKEPIYDEKLLNDYDVEKVIGYKTISFGEQHLKELASWIERIQESGYEIKFYEM